jgi:signal transduction histidine kinase
MIVSVAVLGRSDGVIFGGLAASCAGLVMGISRRQAVEATRQAALLEVETERAGIERGRAQLLAERNHLARELHDVLAHTLSALSLQLEALDTVVEVGSESSERLHEHIRGLRRLVQEGLVEAKGAVQALREDAPPLLEQLRRLSIEQHVALSVDGNPPALTPQASLSLYRIAQEALTNALKHAPGAVVAMRVDGAPERVRLVVENGPSSSASVLGASGGGFGLQGIEERLALLGGSLEAGPTEDGWRVVAEVPVQT